MTNNIKMADGTTITYDFYPKRGAKTIVLLHGNGGSRHYFEQQLQIYRTNLQVLVPDSRGHGGSTNTQSELTFMQIVNDIHTLLLTLKIEKVIIVGFSDGANLAMLFTKHFPNMVEKLVLNAGNINLQGVRLSCLLVDYVAYFMLKIFSLLFTSLRRVAQQKQLLVQSPKMSWEDLAQISVPTLVVAGSLDIIKKQHTKQIAANIPDSNLRIVPGVGHTFGAKFPIRFAIMVMDFIQE